MVDVRPAREYAEGHLPGSLSIPFGPPCAVYAAWLTPWGGDLVLVSDSEQELRSIEIQLACIGVEGVALSLLRRSGRDWRGLRLTDWAGYAAEPDPGHDLRRTVLDVRHPGEWRAGHLAGSVNVPVHELPHRLTELPGGELWVHCEAGYRAALAAGVLDRAGRRVVLVDDGLARVAELGLPLVRSPLAA